MIQKIFNEEVFHFQKIDLFIIFLITFFYGFLSFIHLGNNDSPNTFYTLQANEHFDVSFSNEVDVICMKLFTGVRSSDYYIYTSNDGVNYELYNYYESPEVFNWVDINISTKTKYIRFKTVDELSIGEIGFYDNTKSYIPFSSHHSSMNDEKDFIPLKQSFMNTAYFDEIYFARTAYEYVYGLTIYEWTHPPLGKIIQAIPIYITHRVTPFLYRLMGNISGILIVLVMYVFGFILFHIRKYALISSLLMILDTFHFAHTRMGTVDSHLVLFGTLALLFMVLFIQKEKNLYLFLSGLFFGLGICIKWSGLYCGFALCILFFTYLFSYKKFHYTYIIKGFLFFVLIPLLLYFGIFYIFPNNYYKTNTFSNIIKQNELMYDYHSNLKTSHSSSSKFYTWPISYKPVWYSYSYYKETNTASTISGVGNLVIWYIGLLSMIYLFLVFVTTRDKLSFFLFISFLCLWLPYMFISRVMFLYHYFPSLPILFLGVVYLLRDLEKIYHFKRVVPIYLLCCLLFFIIYFPIVSGIEVPSDYISNLELFDSWRFN